MSKRRVVTGESGQPMTGKRRLRLVDPFALGLWTVILFVTAFLAEIGRASCRERV